MTEKENKGLLSNWSDIDEDYRVEFQKWHNCEHMAERVSIPGICVGKRYQGIAKAPDFFMYYETENSKILASDPYLHSQNNPTPWTKRSLPYLKNLVRGIYNLLACGGEKYPTESPYIHVVRFNIKSGHEKKIIHWFINEHLKKILAIHGIYRVRLYEMDDEISNISTEERKIHGGGPGQQKFLAIYEIANLDLPESKVWREAIEGSEETQNILKNWENIIKESYWLDFTMYAPK